MLVEVAYPSLSLKSLMQSSFARHTLGEHRSFANSCSLNLFTSKSFDIRRIAKAFRGRIFGRSRWCHSSSVSSVPLRILFKTSWKWESFCRWICSNLTCRSFSSFHTFALKAHLELQVTPTAPSGNLHPLDMQFGSLLLGCMSAPHCKHRAKGLTGGTRESWS